MNETVHFFGSGAGVFGIVSHAEPEVRKPLAAIILNAGQVHHIGPNRLHVGVARALAAAGYTCVRIDQSGKGESPPRAGMTRHQALSQDFNDVKSYLTQIGAERFVLIGLCSGADDALVIARDNPDVSGLALLDSFAAHSAMRFVEYGMREIIGGDWIKHPPRNVVERLKGRISKRAGEVDVREWGPAREMNAYYDHFLGRGGKMLAIFTHGARYYTGRHQLGRTLHTDRGLTEVYWRNASHTFNEREYRDRLRATLVDWMSANFG